MSTNAYTEGLHREVREELHRIDSKISTLLAVFGIAVSIIAGAMIAGDADPRSLSDPYEAAFWIGTALGLGSIAQLVAALHPVVSHHEDRALLRYFGHVAEFENLNAFREALHGEERNEALRVEEQTHTLSRIVTRKYRWTSRAVYAYAGAVLCELLAAVGA